ncbi:hypothetical protein PMZ80_006314 [Knufia obscura]|uniref:Uncharacterized protein n=2 Tax=Knufia TaxID=430999 RepID=A0AAN8IMT7_9EURO|nr:hypothetical protein PMZ80_006314 [Knufia obscura]KAK5953542.1 hypothetical protein OHC33_005486 [Knufia fluminis]
MCFRDKSGLKYGTEDSDSYVKVRPQMVSKRPGGAYGFTTGGRSGMHGHPGGRGAVSAGLFGYSGGGGVFGGDGGGGGGGGCGGGDGGGGGGGGGGC